MATFSHRTLRTGMIVGMAMLFGSNAAIADLALPYERRHGC